MVNNTPNVKGLLKHASEKRIVALKKVKEAIIQLQQENKKISFNSVSNASGVSKTFLYNNSDVRLQIEQLRETSQLKTYKVQLSDSSKDVLIESLKNRIKTMGDQMKKLEQDNTFLKKQIKGFLGQAYDNI
ncbi:MULTISPECIES: DUF6262 family protein [Bacillus subtilis group]|uniref:DUF6262 family protein n=1 Tax=Bacillus subtilis group TaxID=653685 RepID=UPI00089DEFB7|nr:MULTISPECIES: DUF6262 family protein [Bacillus subtilis group]AOY07520.1 hypothetical protein BKN48_20285 [Bacillus subtilis]MCY7919304.1 DUF6262 family protein [Bacillus vallismortis]MCY8310894.1 DUF6262 family protein [Bacillus vallismortis]MCY8598325.1 DUF6262 family protein [Bacillus vallismortis]MEC1649453.1 DUF6262 family protein [Bacillus vallismortis]